MHCDTMRYPSTSALPKVDIPLLVQRGYGVTNCSLQWVSLPDTFEGTGERADPHIVMFRHDVGLVPDTVNLGSCLLVECDASACS